MKKVTFQYTCEFPDDISDADAIASTIEIVSQADYDDDNFIIATDQGRAEAREAYTKAAMDRIDNWCSSVQDCELPFAIKTAILGELRIMYDIDPRSY